MSKGTTIYLNEDEINRIETKRQRLADLFEEVGGVKYVEKVYLATFNKKKPWKVEEATGQVYMVPFSFDLFKKVEKEILDDDGKLLEVEEEWKDSYSGYPSNLVKTFVPGEYPLRECINWIIPTGNKIKGLEDFTGFMSKCHKERVKLLRANDEKAFERLEKEKQRKWDIMFGDDEAEELEEINLKADGKLRNFVNKVKQILKRD